MSNIDGFAFAPARLMERLVGFLVGIAARGFFPVPVLPILAAR